MFWIYLNVTYLLRSFINVSAVEFEIWPAGGSVDILFILYGVTYFRLFDLNNNNNNAHFI